jgi:predicted transcriptional regulator
LRNPNRQEMADAAGRLRKEGKSTAEIAKILGVAYQTVERYLHDPTGARHRADMRRYDERRRFPPTKEGALRKYNLPVTEQMRMRPVWERRQRRIYGNVNELAPATEEEKLDAISILADPTVEKEAPALWYEAFRIFEEESQ